MESFITRYVLGSVALPLIAVDIIIKSVQGVDSSCFVLGTSKTSFLHCQCAPSSIYRSQLRLILPFHSSSLRTPSVRSNRDISWTFSQYRVTTFIHWVIAMGSIYVNTAVWYMYQNDWHNLYLRSAAITALVSNIYPLSNCFTTRSWHSDHQYRISQKLAETVENRRNFYWKTRSFPCSFYLEFLNELIPG